MGARSFFFANEGSLKRVPVGGGAPVTLCDVKGGFGGGAWSPDDTIYYGTTDGGLMAVSSDGGDPRTVTVPDRNAGEISHVNPNVLPNGRAVLFTVWRGSSASSSVDAVVVATGERRTLVDGANFPLASSTGHLLFVRRQTAFAMRLDLEQVEVFGAEASVADDLRWSYLFDHGNVSIDLARDGTLTYVEQTRTQAARSLVLVDRTGRVVRELTAEPRVYVTPRVSNDGTRIAVGIIDAQSIYRQQPRSSDLWTIDIDRGVVKRLTREGTNYEPYWSPDDRNIAFASDRGAGGHSNVFEIAYDGAEPPRPLTTSRYHSVAVEWYAPQRVLTARLEPSRFVFPTLDLSTGEESLEWSQPGFIDALDVSPNGEWVTFETRETGRSEVYVARFPSGASKETISTNGGTSPRFSRDGREIVFRRGDAMLAASVGTEPSLVLGRPVELFQGDYSSYTPGYDYDVTPDGRFVMVRLEEEQRPARYRTHLVQNFAAELERLLPH